MRPIGFTLILITCLMWLPGAAQAQVTLPARQVKGNILKMEGDLILYWHVKSMDPKTAQVEVVGSDGSTLASLNVLRVVPEAKRVSVHDISALPNRFLVVSAVYVDRVNRPAATLLYFDWSGTLTRFLALDPTREAWHVAVDANGNVWTMTTHSGDADPAKVPLIVEYDANGQVRRELLPRSEFPPHAQTLVESPTAGSVSFGISGDDLRFWLPVSSDLVAINTRTGAVTRAKATPLPTADPEGHRIVPLKVFITGDGSILAEMRVEESPTIAHLAWMRLPPNATAWQDTTCPSCSGLRLVGTSGEKLMYATSGPVRTLFPKTLQGSQIE